MKANDGVSPEVAEIDKERDVTVALINAASSSACCDFPVHDKDGEEHVRRALQYLERQWDPASSPAKANMDILFDLKGIPDPL